MSSIFNILVVIIGIAKNSRAVSSNRFDVVIQEIASSAIFEQIVYYSLSIVAIIVF